MVVYQYWVFNVGLRARRVAKRHHGRRPAVLSAVEQPPINAGVRLRYSVGKGNSRGLHLGGRRADAEGTQSGPVRVQSLFRGGYRVSETALSRSIAIVFKLLARQHSFALINIPVVTF